MNETVDDTATDVNPTTPVPTHSTNTNTNPNPNFNINTDTDTEPTEPAIPQNTPCATPIPLASLGEVATPAEFLAYRLKLRELGTPAHERLYCHDRDGCGMFLGSLLVPSAPVSSSSSASSSFFSGLSSSGPDSSSGGDEEKDEEEERGGALSALREGDIRDKEVREEDFVRDDRHRKATRQ
ncbi:hypothetical protein NEMBOFW57_002201 [Staphylotrichum longicolle]|uniref:Uncharacterized protein n=1 Tax=Staphylotrichum longicolle TaxID=669026 RepID=A0AAD4F2L5_9PEZI|nr:hypothetical protein NEMBOFW57_002201 [Staphylotrichum longicolle]